MAELNDMIPFDELSKIESRFKSNYLNNIYIYYLRNKLFFIKIF